MFNPSDPYIERPKGDKSSSHFIAAATWSQSLYSVSCKVIFLEVEEGEDIYCSVVSNPWPASWRSILIFSTHEYSYLCPCVPVSVSVSVRMHSESC